MDDVFSKIVAIILGSIIFFVLPLEFVSERQKNMVQTYAYSETMSFVNQICNKGIVYEADYIKYKNKLLMTGKILSVEITHIPGEAESVNDFTNQFEKKLSEERCYKMKKGDFIRIEVMDEKDNPLIFYGGKIKDEDY